MLWSMETPWAHCCRRLLVGAISCIVQAWESMRRSSSSPLHPHTPLRFIFTIHKNVTSLLIYSIQVTEALFHIMLERLNHKAEHHAYRGWILGQNPDKSLKSFPSLLFKVTSTALPWALNFLKLTQPLTVSKVQVLYTVKEKGRKPDGKTISPILLFKKSIQKPQVWELSRWCPDTSTKFYLHEFVFSTVYSLTEHAAKVCCFLLDYNNNYFLYSVFLNRAYDWSVLFLVG